MKKEDNLVVRYSDKDLGSFKKIIEEKISKAQRDLELIRSAYMNDGNNGTEDTSPTFKAFEEGSQTMSKEAKKNKYMSGEGCPLFNIRWLFS